MKRSDAIRYIKANAAKGDIAECTRIFIESRISRVIYDQAVYEGRAFGEFIRKRDATKATQ